jgi:hypothetical protein
MRLPVDEQHHGRALTLRIVMPAIYALAKELTIAAAIMKTSHSGTPGDGVPRIF